MFVSMDVREQKTIYLWGLPRSLSTAVLRAMVTVDGCLVSAAVTFQLLYLESVSPTRTNEVMVGVTHEATVTDSGQRFVKHCQEKDHRDIGTSYFMFN